MTGCYGEDWASYQSANPDVTGLSFVFVKIDEGENYTNPLWVQQRDWAKSHGLVWGGYHYPNMHNDPVAEANLFVSRVNWQPGDLVALDWEGYDPANQGLTGAQQDAFKDAFLARVKQLLPNNPVGMYCNTDYWLRVDTNSNAGDFLWIATAGRAAGDPGIRAPWMFHQYSSNSVDKDYCPLSAADLKAWTLSFQPKPVNPPVQKETDMPQWINGTVEPGTKATVVLVPHGDAWAANPNRALHLGMEEVGTPDAKASVRVAIHDGTSWRLYDAVQLTAAGGTLDLALTNKDEKISFLINSDASSTNLPSVAYAIEVW